MRILELGSYVAPAYAGMVLAEQGHYVEKWTNGRDPILSLRRGDELWAWVNHGKNVIHRDAREVPEALFDALNEMGGFHIVLDNFTPSALERLGLDPEALAREHELVWVSLRSEVGERSFDLVAQARSWREYSPHVPFFVGDTCAGLWMAFKALAAQTPGHYVLGQATVMQKLVEGELVVDVSRESPHGRGAIANPWDMDEYRDAGDHVRVAHKGVLHLEPVRDRSWKLEHLWHDHGRMRV
jgi:hypothetical protein